MGFSGAGYNLGLVDELAEKLALNDQHTIRTFFGRNGLPPPQLLWRPTGADIALSELRDLFDYWGALRRGDLLPDQGQIDPLPLKKVFDNLILLDVCGDGEDFSYVYYGDKVSQGTRDTGIGRKVSEVPVGSSFLPFYIATYRSLLRLREPLLTIHQPLPKYGVKRWIRLFLPLSDGTGRVTRFLVGAVPLGSRGAIGNDNFPSIASKSLDSEFHTSQSTNCFISAIGKVARLGPKKTRILFPVEQEQGSRTPERIVLKSTFLAYPRKSPQNVRNEIVAISSADWRKVSNYAKYMTRLNRQRSDDPEDLTQEAIRRIFEGSRKCPIHVDILDFLKGIVRSIAGQKAWTQRKLNLPLRLEKSINELDEEVLQLADASPNQEEILSSGQTVEILLSLFEDRPDAQAVIIGHFDGLNAADIRAETQFDRTTYNSLRRLIRRRVDRAIQDNIL